jgi:hypothetical protein
VVNTALLNRVCPSCASPNTHTSGAVVSLNPAENFTFEELQDFWRGFRAKNVFFTYKRCDTCALLYCPKFFTEEQLSSLYKMMDDNTAGEDEVTLSRTQNRYVKDLGSHDDLRGNWLELGADIGLLTKSLLQRPEVVNVDVIEPNISVHKRLTESLGATGKILNSLDEVSAGSYDGVTAIHVLDHITELSSHLEQISNALKPGGKVYFVTHNEDSLMRKLIQKRWPPFCLQHPQLFTPHSITAALERAGFDVISVQKTTNFFSLRHMGSVFFAIFRLPVSWARVIPPLVLPMKLGNISTYAIKR